MKRNYNIMLRLLAIAFSRNLRYYHAMPRGLKPGKTTVVYVRDVPRDVFQKLKGAAALQGYRSVNAYLLDHLKAHVAELERRGILPRGRT